MTAPTIEGSLKMIQPIWHHLSPGQHHAAGELYQTSLVAALLKGVYEGQTTYGELRKHGDFGLGTFNHLDGEMVGFDGTFYQLRSDGSARPVAGEPREGFPPGTPWDRVPDEWACPDCGVREKVDFLPADE